MTSDLERKVMGGLGLASIIIAGVTVVYHFSTERLVESAGRVSETHALIAGLNDFAGQMQTVRMATRGYLITGDESVLRLNNRARSEAMSALASLRDASSTQEQHRRVVQHIEKLAQKRLEGGEALIEMRRREGEAIVPFALVQLYREDVADPLRDCVERLLNESRIQLSDRQSLARDSSAAMLWLLMFGAIVELAFAMAAAGVIRAHIRERSRVMAELRRSEATLRGFYDSGVTMMGIVELTGDGDILHISDNSATGHFMDRPAHLLAGRTASALGMPKHEVSMWRDRYEQSLRRGGPVQFEYLHEGRGKRSWLSVVVCPITRSSGTQRYSYVVLDVTERKHAEEALKLHAQQLAAAKDVLEKQSVALEDARLAAEAANVAKSNFLANMSHEIRTPMTAVVGYADLLGEKGRSDEQRREWVGVIRRNARHLLELINNILDLSKIEAGRMTLELVPCDPAQIVGDVVAMLRSRAEQKGVTIRLDVEGPLPREMGGDPLRLRQVLINLVGNAIKFTDAGEVQVRVQYDAGAIGPENAAGALRIDVSDTGIGITEAQLARLFRPFTQADETTTRRFGGTGLGLAISHRLIVLMGGTVTARSEAGIGSTFTVSLPVRMPQAQPAGAPGEASPLLYGQTEPVAVTGRILVVEDTPDTQRLLSIVLAGAGADVTVASDGQTALELCAKEKFDLILMDMQMPKMDGYAATRELRRHRVDVPIIALTSHAMSGDRERSLAAGCSEYLSKPIDVPLLLARIARHLSPTKEKAKVA